MHELTCKYCGEKNLHWATFHGKVMLATESGRKHVCDEVKKAQHLKPCPFCGAEAIKHSDETIQCSKCTATIVSEVNVREAWNKRYRSPQITPLEQKRK